MRVKIDQPQFKQPKKQILYIDSLQTIRYRIPNVRHLEKNDQKESGPRVLFKFGNWTITLAMLQKLFLFRKFKPIRINSIKLYKNILFTTYCYCNWNDSPNKI